MTKEEAIVILSGLRNSTTYGSFVTEALSMAITALNDHEFKHGHWIPLGHRMGVCKHPYSEDYKCSVCGYEQYTLMFAPPQVCPLCHSLMSEKEEKNNEV